MSREFAAVQVAGAALLTVGLIGSVLLGLLSPLLGVAMVVAMIAAGVKLWRTLSPDVVCSPGWRYQGVPIRGEAFSLLEDIDRRFAYAEKLVGQVPTGIEWAEIAEDVQALMWESAGHAARVSALDVELGELHYAAPGTPQGALKGALEERRTEHLNMLLNAQREADDLAAVAGNAAAAARLALARTGSLAALEVVTPSGRGLLARSALAEARARLELLTQVWTELDETGLLLGEQSKSLSAPESEERGKLSRGGPSANS